LMSGAKMNPEDKDIARAQSFQGSSLGW
jgi:hypothetical protein